MLVPTMRSGPQAVSLERARNPDMGPAACAAASEGEGEAIGEGRVAHRLSEAA